MLYENICLFFKQVIRLNYKWLYKHIQEQREDLFAHVDKIHLFLFYFEKGSIVSVDVQMPYTASVQ